MSHKYVSLIKDENNVEYFIHDNRFVDGLVDDTTISLLSQESENKNHSGILGFYWSDYTKSGSTAVFTVCNGSDTPPELTYRGIVANDVVSILSRSEDGYEANYYGKVISINGSTLTCSYDENIVVPSSFDPSQGKFSSGYPGILWFPEKPSVGDVKFGAGSVALGEKNNTNSFCSFSTGRANVSDGSISSTIGLNNVAGNLSSAIGTSNYVFGHESAAIGTSNYIFDEKSFAIGNNNAIHSKNSITIGNNLSCNSDGQIVLGNDLNVPSDSSSYALMIGGASGNPLMLKTNGDLFVRGDVYSKSNGNDSSTAGGFKLNGVRTSSSKMYLMGTTVGTLPATSTTVENFANS